MIVNGCKIEPYANLRYANLRYANLRGANLRGANLWGANLQGANLQGANLLGTDLPPFQICPEVGSFVMKQQLIEKALWKIVNTEGQEQQQWIAKAHIMLNGGDRSASVAREIANS